jgi:hypothetical protein
MVIGRLDWNEKADRAFTRPAFHNRQLNVSIRADFGERAKSTVDRMLQSNTYYAIELPVIHMTESEILAAMIRHKEKCSGYVSEWFAGVRFAPRLHPWDEQELSFPTKAWLDLSADTGDQAQRVAYSLFSMGCEKSPLHTESPTAKHVFVYSLNKESLN